MSGPALSVVVLHGDAARLPKTVRSAAASARAAGVPFEIVVGAADGDAPDHPQVRGWAGSLRTTREAAEVAWGTVVILVRAGDLLPPAYVRLLQGPGDREILRPQCCVGYGGDPFVRAQASLADDPVGRGRLVFGAPFTPPLAAARSLLAGLPPRSWDEGDDWGWTRTTLAQGVTHRVVEGAVHVSWSRPEAAPLRLPPTEHPGPPPQHLAETERPDPLVQALLYGRASLSRLAAIEQRLADLLAEADRGRAGEEVLRGALAEAEGRARALQGSTSWRLTAPLRALVSALGKRGA